MHLTLESTRKCCACFAVSSDCLIIGVSKVNSFRIVVNVEISMVLGSQNMLDLLFCSVV